MRVAHVIPSLATGGAESLVVNLAVELRSRDVDVRIITLADRAGNPADAARAAGIDVRSLGGAVRDPRAVHGIARLARGFDVVHSHLFPSLYFTAAARTGSPSVYTEHSTHNSRRSVRALRPMERWAYSRYDELIAISEGVNRSLRSHLRSLGIDRDPVTIHNGIGADFHADERARPPARRPGPLRVIAIGRLDERKNFAEAIEIMGLVDDAELTIVGSGPEEGRLRQRIVETSLEGRVTLHGPSSAVKELLDEHDVLLSTSRYEGFGLVAAEAMARGLPVVAPRVEGLGEVVVDGETGVLYPVGEAGRPFAAEALARLRDDGSLYETLAAGAVDRSHEFSIEASASAHLRLYEQLARR